MDVSDSGQAPEQYPGCLAELPLDVAKRTLEKAEKPDACCSEGRNCLFYAVLRTDVDEACELARSILEAEIVDPKHTDMYGQTALYYASREGHTRCVEMLVEEFFMDVSHIDHAKQSPLFYAAREGRTDTLVFLIKMGADINLVDANGDTPIFYAARDGQEETIKKMIELGADCSIRNKKKAYVSTIARKSGHKRLAAELDVARRNHTVNRVGGESAASGGDGVELKSGRGPRTRRAAAAAAAAAAGSPSPSPNRKKRPPSKADSTVSETPSVKRRATRTSVRTQVSSDGGESVEESLISPAPLTPSPPPPPPLPELPSPPAPTVVAAPPPEVSPAPPPERHIYCLQFLGPNRIWTFASPAKLKEFAALYPKLALWDPEAPLTPVGLENDPFKAKWHDLALKLVDHMLSDKIEGAWLFSAPVDPVEWSIEDYFSVVKNPMDFSTIRQSLLEEVHYTTIASFLSDVDLVFSNCILYNSASSKVGQLGLEVQAACKEYSKRIGFDELAEEERLRDEVALQIAAAAASSKDVDEECLSECRQDRHSATTASPQTMRTDDSAELRQEEEGSSCSPASSLINYPTQSDGGEATVTDTTLPAVKANQSLELGEEVLDGGQSLMNDGQSALSPGQLLMNDDGQSDTRAPVPRQDSGDRRLDDFTLEEEGEPCLPPAEARRCNVEESGRLDQSNEAPSTGRHQESSDDSSALVGLMNKYDGDGGEKYDGGGGEKYDGDGGEKYDGDGGEKYDGDGGEKYDGGGGEKYDGGGGGAEEAEASFVEMSSGLDELGSSYEHLLENTAGSLVDDFGTPVVGGDEIFDLSYNSLEGRTILSGDGAGNAVALETSVDMTEVTSHELRLQAANEALENMSSTYGAYTEEGELGEDLCCPGALFPNSMSLDSSFLTRDASSTSMEECSAVDPCSKLSSSERQQQLPADPKLPSPSSLSTSSTDY